MSNRGQGSAGIAVAVTAVIVIALSSLGYYQYVYVGTSTSTSSSSTETRPLPQINITVGAAAKTDDAYTPNPITLVIGVNSTFVVYNGDVQSGVGVPHSFTDKGGAFDTGVLQGGDTSKAITVSTPGTYTVYCVIHPTTMRATVKVVQGTGGTTTGTRSSTSASSTPSSTSSTSQATSSSGSSVAVQIVNGAAKSTGSPGFDPSTIRLVVGVNSTVVWTNDDSSPHTVTAKDGSFDSGNLDPGKPFTHVFTAAGTFEIFCKYHSWMHETVIVEAAK